ncbi:Mut7-C RNAse domain-containing protein [Elusimicrobiota bacterium]
MMEQKRKRQHKFLVDAMVGRLTTWLRILDFDAVQVKESQRNKLLERSFLENRTILTRETQLASAHSFGLALITTEHWQDQIKELWKILKLKRIDKKRVFTRCTQCNHSVKKIAKSNIRKGKVPPRILETINDFSQCPKCRKIFWAGSHVDNTIASLKEIGILKNAKCEKAGGRKE